MAFLTSMLTVLVLLVIVLANNYNCNWVAVLCLAFSVFLLMSQGVRYCFMSFVYLERVHLRYSI